MTRKVIKTDRNKATPVRDLQNDHSCESHDHPAHICRFKNSDNDYMQNIPEERLEDAPEHEDYVDSER